MGKHFEKSLSSFSTVDHQQIIEARYRTAMEDVTSLVVGFTHDGTITCASRGFVLSVGLTEEEGLLGSNLFSLIYPPDLDKLLQAIKQVGPKHSMRCQLRLCVDNKLVQQKWDIRGVVDRTGNLIEYQATGKVVLGDLLIRAQLQDNSLFRELTENIPVMIYMISKSKFLYANQMFQNNFGYTQAELLNMDFWELIHPDHREFIKKQALAKLAGDKNTANHREIKGIRKDGSPLWGDAFVNTMRINGETVGLVAAYDITERKMLEEELERAHRELEEKVQERTEELRRTNQELIMLNYNLNNIIKNMSDGVILFNRDGSCKSLNPAFEKTWGIKIQNWQDYSDIRYLQEKVFEQGVSLPEEEFIIPTDRGQAYFLASATPLRDEEGKSLLCEKGHKIYRCFSNTFFIRPIRTGRNASMFLIIR